MNTDNYLIWRVFAFACIVVGLSSCSTRDPLFDVNSDTNFTILAGLSILETHGIVKDNVRIPIELTVQSLGLNADDIDEIVPFSGSIRSRFNDNVDLNFINAVNIYIIEKPSNRRRELFYLDFVPLGNKTEIELLPTLIDIRDLVDNDQAVIDIALEFRQFPPTNVEMSLDMRFSGFASEN